MRAQVRRKQASRPARIAERSGVAAGEERPEGYVEGRRVARELNLIWQEHCLRHYDPSLGRFNQYEPLADNDTEAFATSTIGTTEDYLLIFFDCITFIANTLEKDKLNTGFSMLIGHNLHSLAVSYLSQNHIPDMRFISITRNNKGYFIPLH